MENGGGRGEAMEEKAGEQQGSSSSPYGYRYWVREATSDAAPLPVPIKLSPQPDPQLDPQQSLGSLWNRAGTWEERNLTPWASHRIKELLNSVGFLDLSAGKAQITQVSKCIGDAFLVTVRNKKRVGYTYELTLQVKGEWLIREEKKMLKGHIDIPEFSFGELDDLQMEVRISEEKDLLQQDEVQIIQDLKQFLQPVREKLHQFEQELKDR
ncbi:Aha1_N domain-containing protein [Cephalotus follicularis]|uniref:Aha1_N domain-containing protein n=1 Tax=Cephalotus follicularis TaxID=3775 RepID=A0A1Q3CSB6_CEPFO|nr:Aha1_N domain-containing protein [Cephalotus follicularis]